MPASKGKRTKKSTTPVVPTPTTDQEQAVESAPVESAPVESAPVESAPVGTAPVVPESTVSLSDDFTDMMSTLALLKTTVATLSTRMRALQKKAEREIKTAQKQKKKRGPLSADGTPRKPSGFVKPSDITAELAKFLGKDKGVQMARTEVTREINKYTREHKLQDPSNGRIIRPDTSLRKLLKVKTSDELTYFNLQKYMSPHFVKSVPVTASA